MDKLGLWGLLIGVVALMLTIPMNILSNVVTPKVLAWWATTSSNRRQRRLLKLDAIISDIPRLRSAVYRQEAFIAGMIWLVSGLVSMTTLIFSTASNLIFLSASLDHVQPIIPGPSVTISVVWLYRFQTLVSFFLVVLSMYSLSQAFQSFKRASRLYAQGKLDEAAKELKALQK